MAWKDGDPDGEDDEYAADLSLDVATKHNSYIAYLVDTTKTPSLPMGVGDEEKHLRICFNVHKHESYVEFRFIGMVLDGDMNLCKTMSLLKLPRSVFHTMSLRELTVKEQIEHLNISPADGDVFYILSLTFVQHAFVVSENLFTFGNHVTGRYADMIHVLKNATDYNVLIRGSSKTASDEHALAQAFEEARNSAFSAWFPKTGRLVLQKKAMLARDSRPKYMLDAKCSFSSKVDLAVTFGFAAIQEEELYVSRASAINVDVMQIKVLEILHAGDRRYYGILPKSVDIDFRFTTGDSLLLNFDIDDRDQTKTWHAFVVDTLACAPTGTDTIVMTRPWNKETLTWGGQDVIFNAVKVEQQTSIDDTRRAIAKAAPTDIAVRLITSNKVYSRRMVAWEKINTLPETDELVRLLCGNDYTTLHKHDIYKSVRAVNPNFADAMNIDKNQRLAVQQMSAAPARMFLGIGPPGTGKTHTIIELVMPFATNQSQHHQVLLTSPLNHAVNDLALAAHERATAIREKDPAIKYILVVRVHNFDTEKDIVFRDAKKHHTIPLNARPPILSTVTDESMQLLAQLSVAKDNHEKYVSDTSQKFEGINDKRVQLLELSLGYRMLQLAGIVPAPFSQPGDHQDFIEHFRDIIVADLTRTDSAGFIAILNRLIVLTSRARNGFYIIGNKTAMDKFKARDKRHIVKLVSMLLPYRYVVKNVECDFFSMDQVRLHDAFDGVNRDQDVADRRQV